MPDIGYYEQVEGGIFGTSNPATDSNPEARAALQAEYAQMQQQRTTVPGYVPQSYEKLGGGNVPTIGWTAQGPATAPVFPPYSSEDIGRVPDWNADGIPNTGGNYDMTFPVAYGDYNPLNRAPIGDGLLQYDDTQTDPNFLPQDQGGTIDLEW